MFTAILDANSPFHAGLPENDQPDKLVTAGETFLTYDSTLPPEQQSPFKDDIAQLLQDCSPQQDEFKQSEAQRTIASENLKRFEEQAYRFLQRIHLNLKSYLYETPEEAEEWGFEVKQSTRNIMMPSKKDRLKVLSRYIAKEESRPEAERFVTPDLAAITEVRDQLQERKKRIHSSHVQRKSSRVARDATLQALKDTLRAAGTVIIVKHLGRVISPELGKWGYEVYERSSRPDNPNDAPPPDSAVDEPAIDNADTNGSQESGTLANVVIRATRNGRRS
ncbi:MAG: hypothetical protein H6631_09205 [Anaerolineaceae bacterium]|nr:hypothetical protein [Anaerolineaceae bacterium]MCB9101867.1 hypothetical protein [Anaerolineales bacterium]